MTETFIVYPCSGDVPQAQQPREWMGLIGVVLWVERRGAGGRMASRGRFWPVQWVLYPGGGLGVRGCRASGIGQRGGAFWTVLWTTFTGVVGGVGGETLRSEMSRFQCVCMVSRACSCRVGQLRLRGAGPRRRGQGALQEFARHGLVMFTLG
jgi:hypothetical protein